MACELKRIDRCVTAHEADHRALDCGRKPATFDYVEIESGRIHSGARSDYEVRDAMAVLTEVQSPDRFSGKCWCEVLVQAHTGRCLRKIAADVERVGVEHRASVPIGGRFEA